jgi:hypothetical protein
MKTPSTQQELEMLITAFEDATLSKEDWDHCAHTVVTAFYVEKYGFPVAMKKLRKGISKLNRHHRVRNSPTRGYHETLTMFWVSLISAFLEKLDSEEQLIQRIASVANHFGIRRDLWHDLYTYDLLNNPIARRKWCAPDVWSGPAKRGRNQK